LLNRLDINIEYFSDEIFVFLNDKKSVDFRPKSTVKLIKDDSFDTYFLGDEKQYEKLFLEKYDGLNELYRQQYWNMFGCNKIPSNEKIEEEKHELLFNNYDLRFDDESDTKWLNIYNYCVNIHIP
jgi:hypothetical protein